MCTTKESIQNAAFTYEGARTKYSTAPCRRVSKLTSLKTDLFEDPGNNNTWAFHLVYPYDVKVITQAKEVDIHSLIGNIGGYVGLFLGNR